METEKIRAKVKVMIGEERYIHSMGVANEAVKLADAYGAPADKAFLAGILHDCAKDIKRERALELFTKFGLVIDDITLNEPKLIHGPLGACIAQYEFGILDTEILDAIWFHTSAKSNMNLLTKIIYIADYIEPGRDFDRVDELRLLAYENLNEAIVLGLNMTINEIIAQGRLVHPDSIHARNFIIMAGKKWGE